MHFHRPPGTRCARYCSRPVAHRRWPRPHRLHRPPCCHPSQELETGINVDVGDHHPFVMWWIGRGRSSTALLSWRWWLTAVWVSTGVLRWATRLTSTVACPCAPAPRTGLPSMAYPSRWPSSVGGAGLGSASSRTTWASTSASSVAAWRLAHWAMAAGVRCWPSKPLKMTPQRTSHANCLPRGADRARAAACYRRSIALYRGDLCSATDVEHVLERERLRRRFLSLLAHLADDPFARRTKVRVWHMPGGCWNMIPAARMPIAS